MEYRHSSKSVTRTWTLLCLVFCALSVLAASPVWAQISATVSPSATFRPHTPRKVQDGTAALVGHYDPTQKLRLTLGLQPPHVEEEREFLESLQTKGAHDFHQFLTAEEWTKRFDPSVEDEQAVVDWATSQGLTVTRRFPNRLLVDVEGTAGTIEKAFGVSLNSYKVGTRIAFSNDHDAQVPEHLVNIIHSVGGLQNVDMLRPASKNVKEPVFPDYAPGPAISIGQGVHGNGDRSKLPQSLKAAQKGSLASSKGGLKSNYDSGPPYDPQDMYSTAAYSAAALYNLGHCCNPTGNAAGSPPESSIAIATFGSQQGSDLTGFQSNFPYLAYYWYVINVDGTPACCDGEGTMDLEWSTAMANSFGSYLNTARVYMYDGVSPTFGESNDVYNTMLTNGYARNFSTSWGCEEYYCYDAADMDTADSIFASMVGQGWSLTAASGDQGASAGCGDATAVQYPSSDPYVVGAGGTTMYMFGGPPPSFYSFSAWSGGPYGCGSNDGGSTGGYSIWWGTPSYQSYLGIGSRGVPDIALNADWYNTPQYYYFEGSLGSNGGTSIVAPETVGFFAQENAYLLALGNICGSGETSPCAPMGAVNPYLYRAATGGALDNPFYDVTSGCNNNDVTAYYGLTYYCAGTGWDAVTGLGTYNFLQLAWAINWEHVPGLNTPTVTFSGPAINTWYNTDAYVSWSIGNIGYDGTAGLSQAWDSDPGNPRSEATPGLSGFPGSPYNAFYDGPMYPNSTAGCLDFTGTYCAGSVGGVQGWHTVNVRSWGNEGENGGDYTYGPLGYDTIAPVTTPHLSGTLISGTSYKSAVTVTLTPADSGYPSTGSGVAQTYYAINSGSYQAYSAPFTVGYTGTYTIHFYSYDKGGNYEAVKSSSFTIKPVLSLSAASLAFGNQVWNTTSAGKAVTVTNITTSSVSISSIAASGDYAIPAKTCGATLAGGANCSVTVTFKPTVLGAVSGDVTIAYNAIGSPDRLGLTGTGLAPLTGSPTTLAFGTITVGTTSAAKTLTLKNDNPSTALNIAFSAKGDYTAVAGGGTPCGASLAALASCTLSVTFKPHQNGAINGAVTVTDGVSLSPLVIALSGGGTGGVTSPLSFTPNSLSYTNAVVGTSTAKTVTVKNVSASSITVASVAATGDYTASGCVTTLIPAATCTLTVTLKPTINGTINGAIALTDNTSVSPEVLSVFGTAILPVTLSTGTVNFGAWTVGTTSGTTVVTVTNHTTTSTSLTLAASGDFSAAAGGGTPCGASLGAGASCTFVVKFSPTTTGAVSGVATVTYSTTFSPQEVKLSGTGL